jgi:hypothetical protein
LKRRWHFRFWNALSWYSALFRAELANFAEQPHDGLFRESYHSNSGPDRATFNEALDHAGAFFIREAVHAYIMRNRLRIVNSKVTAAYESKVDLQVWDAMLHESNCAHKIVAV